MTDSNRTRVGIRERFRLNKAAFTDIFGDPFAYPEPIEGAYNRMKRRSSIHVQQINDLAGDTRNPAKPSIYDFFCDAEATVDDTLEAEDTQRRFVRTYITEESTTSFTPEERTTLEQEIGKLLRVRQISPATRYFTVIRKPTGASARRKALSL